MGTRNVCQPPSVYSAVPQTTFKMTVNPKQKRLYIHVHDYMHLSDDNNSLPFKPTNP